MPFKSQAQRKFMYSQHPEMAKEWEAHTPKGKLPEHAAKKKKKHAKNDKESPSEEMMMDEEKDMPKKHKKGMPHVRYEPKGD